MRKVILLFSSILIFQFSAQAQGGEYRKKFTEGNFLILESNFPQALKSFLEAYEIDSTNANINYKIGFCYLKTVTEKTKALRYLEKAVAKTTRNYTDMEPREKSAPVNTFYCYGQALHLNYQFDEAIANFEKFKSFLGPRQVDLLKDVDRQIEMSNNAKLLVAAPINVIITNMGDSINSSYPDYSPALSADEKTIIFTSRRPGSTGGDKDLEDHFYEDIYIAYKKSDSTWTTPASISPSINTITNEASDGLSADAQTLLIYKDANGGDIYYSSLNGNDWTPPQSIGSAINTSSWETSACLSPDGNTLYFVSDRKGGLGGRDIWKSTKLPNGTWSFAQNVGPPINTPYDEESPFIHPSGNVLFFSSKGHQSIGGFDIFFSTKGDKGWEEPLNIGYPINTTDDDLYYVTSPDGKRGYYSSSSRSEGFGEKDIYMISIPERKEQALVLIKGAIISFKGDPLPSALEIVATNIESGIVSGTYTPREGNYTIIIPPNSNYNLSYQNDGQEFYNEIMDVPADAVYQEINKVIHLKHTLPGQPLQIENSEDVTEKKDTASKEVAYVDVTGVLMDENNKPYTNTKVNILNSKDEIVKTTTTDDSGNLTYTRLPENENYMVALEETDDEHIISEKSFVVLKDKNGNKLKTKTTSVSLKTNDKNTVKKVVKNTTAPLKQEQLAKVDKLNFQMFFKYNVTETDVNDAPFKEFVDNLMGLYTKNGAININLVSSASQVPTRAYTSNKELATLRSDKAKEQLIEALKNKGVEVSKITFVKVKSYVSGPQYNIDYNINKGEYEKHQFVKISAY